MTEPEAHVLPTDLPYRRRIELRPSEGVVEAAMEDFMHHFGLRLHHDGTVITAVEVAPERVPWSTCPEGAAGLLRLEGTRLDAVPDLQSWMGGRISQCVHTTDLVLLAAATALRGTPRTYEIWVTGSFLEQRHATMDRDGENWADWTIDGRSVLGDDRFAGLTLGQPAFGEWVAEHLGAGTDDAEAAARAAPRLGDRHGSRPRHGRVDPPRRRPARRRVVPHLPRRRGAGVVPQRRARSARTRTTVPARRSPPPTVLVCAIGRLGGIGFARPVGAPAGRRSTPRTAGVRPDERWGMP